MFGHPVKMLPEDVTDEDDIKKQEDVFFKRHIL